ncbi:MAG: exodeoxyribonuclease VII large subunit [Caulobacterales bacterium 32-69-10]|nr:MAG: exodeoxyribonuclease VII large subunit [Caulobacterales bacterium 32-69-10]
MTDAAAPTETEGNAKAYSVSELASALKRTIEENYGFVRLRGEISKVTRHASGHIYLDIKDENACIAAVVWKGSVRGLKAQPEQGLEVIVTGRITTYAQRSSYQLVVETMEHAGVGALLAQLEKLKERLRGEGLFDAARKRPLPQMPRVVGVITSPTGAVIRDILHRIRDRWPVHVIVWPVVVQGADAAAQVAAAIRGFNALQPGHPVPRPDLLIVARGGGSIEDLWGFNDEALARAVAAGTIPLISAVGHETDTTLIDFVSDRRAPTPTAAAEIATPVLADLKALVLDFERRMARCTQHALETRRSRLAAARLPRQSELLGPASQRFDLAAGRLAAALERNVAIHDRQLTSIAARLTPGLLGRPHALKQARLAELSGRLSASVLRARDQAERRARLPELSARMDQAVQRRLLRERDRLGRIEQLRASLNPDRPLSLGFARVHREDGTLVRDGALLRAGEAIRLKFANDIERGAVVDGTPSAAAKPQPKPVKPPLNQGDLF